MQGEGEREFSAVLAPYMAERSELRRKFMSARISCKEFAEPEFPAWSEFTGDHFNGSRRSRPCACKKQRAVYDDPVKLAWDFGQTVKRDGMEFYAREVRRRSKTA